jgi:uncharacterized protein (TIGR00251 family)
MPVDISIKVIPNASRNEIIGWQQQTLRVKVQAPPEGGRANDAVLMLLIKATGVRKNEIHLVSGDKSRNKVIRIESWTSDDLQRWSSSSTT